MTIIRVSKRDRYVIIDKSGFEDPRISLKAKGLLGYLLTKPNDWKIKSRELTRLGPDNRHAVLAALNELQRFGYLTRERRRDFHGRFVWEQVLHERSLQPHLPTLDPLEDSDHGAISRLRKSAPTTEEGVTETPETEKIDPLTERMIRSCTGRNVKQEAQQVVAMLRTYVDDRLIDEAVGWMMGDAEQKPRRPRYYLAMVANRARECGILVPELQLSPSTAKKLEKS